LDFFFLNSVVEERIGEQHWYF